MISIMGLKNCDCEEVWWQICNPPHMGDGFKRFGVLQKCVRTEKNVSRPVCFACHSQNDRLDLPMNSERKLHGQIPPWPWRRVQTPWRASEYILQLTLKDNKQPLLICQAKVGRSDDAKCCVSRREIRILLYWLGRFHFEATCLARPTKVKDVPSYKPLILPQEIHLDILTLDTM